MLAVSDKVELVKADNLGIIPTNVLFIYIALIMAMMPGPVFGVYGNTTLDQALVQLEFEGPWSWETFLAPLKNSLKPQPSVRNLHLRGGFDESRLVDRFRMELREQHSEITKKKEKELSSAKKDLCRLLKPNVTGYFIGSDLEFGEIERRWKKYERALNIMSDREKSGSIWTTKMLQNYIQRQDIAFVQPESRIDLITGEVLQKICERVDMSIKAISGTQLHQATVADLHQLHSLLNSTESDTKMILDAILQPLCVCKGLTVRSEQTIKCDKLPNNRYDFIIYSHDQPIGVVEAKRQRCLNDQPVAQLLVQLLLLSAENPQFFYFGVLSDAYQFIFAGVTSQKIVFFQTQESQLEIATVKSDQDLTSIAGEISWLADLAIRSMQRKKTIDDFLTPVTCLKVHDSFFNDED